MYVVDDKLRLISKITLKMLIKHEFMNLAPLNFSYFGVLEFIGKKLKKLKIIN